MNTDALTRIGIGLVVLVWPLYRVFNYLSYAQSANLLDGANSALWWGPADTITVVLFLPLGLYLVGTGLRATTRHRAD
ncbi:hypothetical protein AUR64_06700 [Haloprofundus marisrubri]|uniref:Uncharacterized protein n=1 Tax=Haloprofundus marisrubri TaxID=1514971 RepID=A0A0W1RBW9_9EURY|nr:hypothetical protein [Haloprofundus marisrubri]KTG10870.1 hypothetical protein AUR64_06700 [Haloprofundus marisrubri]